MNRIVKLSAISITGLALAFSVFAQMPGRLNSNSDSNEGQSVKEPRNIRMEKMDEKKEIKDNMKGDIKKERETAKENIKQDKNNIKEEMKQNRETMKEGLKGMRKEAKQKMETAREDLKQKIEQKREELKDRIETKREELKERLKNIKDERKKLVVEKIDKRLGELNKKMTDHFVNVLNKLEDVLNRVEDRADKAEEKDIDVALIRTAIDSARGAIVDARESVEVQAGKVYSVEVDTEAKLRTDVGKARQALHADLKAVREVVKLARDAVHKAARAFAEAHGKRLDKSPSPSPSPNLGESEDGDDDRNECLGGPMGCPSVLPSP